MVAQSEVQENKVSTTERPTFQLTKAELRSIANREKRQISFHEAGHYAVCFHFGGRSIPEIWRNSSENVEAGEKAWLGRIKLYAEPGTVLSKKRTKTLWGIVRPPKNWRVLLGLAGLVAEQIADGVTDAGEITDWVHYAMSMGEVSQTDLDLIGGDSCKVSDVAKVVKLQLDMWPSIKLKAKELRMTADYIYRTLKAESDNRVTAAS